MYPVSSRHEPCGRVASPVCADEKECSGEQEVRVVQTSLGYRPGVVVGPAPAPLDDTYLNYFSFVHLSSFLSPPCLLRIGAAACHGYYVFDLRPAVAQVYVRCQY